MLLAVCVVCCAATAGSADDTDDLIKQITAPARTRAEAAAKLLKSAEALSDAPAVQVRLYVKACELGLSSSAGYASALAALDMLDKIAPDRSATWADKRLEVYQQKYTRSSGPAKLANARTYVEMLAGRAEKCGKAGDWPGAVAYYRRADSVAKTLRLPELAGIYERLRAAQNRALVAKRLAGLKAAVANAPHNVVARKRLVETYLVDLDRPIEAARYLNDTLDATLRKNVALAAKDASELADADFLTLAQWYRSLANRTADKETKGRMLVRAKDNLTMYLEVYPKQDVQRLRVTTTLKAVQGELARLGVAPATAARWVDLLALVDPAKYTVAGQWTREDGQLTGADRQYALATVPITATGSYDLQLAFTPKSGHHAGVILPLGAGRTTLGIGSYYGTRAGLSLVAGHKLGEGNPTTVKSEDKKTFLTVGARTTVNVSVRIKGAQADVTVTMNGEKIIAWSGKHLSLTVSDSWPLPANTFGLASHGSTILWHTARLRRLDATDRSLKCVSTDATYKPSSIYSLWGRTAAPLAVFVTGQGKLHRDGYAFHTASQADPNVIVMLKNTEMIERIIIDNRRGQHGSANTGLVVATSIYGRKWTTLWRAKAVRQSWLIDCKLPVRARYVMVSRPSAKSTYLSLAGIRIYAAAGR